MTGVWSVAVGGGVVSLALGAHVWRRLEKWRRPDRVAAALLPTALFYLAFVYAAWIARMLLGYWSAERLASSLGIAYGHSLYFSPTAGPIQSTMYGPVRAILFTPAALASTPTGALLIGGLLNVAAVLLPTALAAAIGCPREARARLHALLALTFAAAALLRSVPTRLILTWVHVDGVAVGFGLLACCVFFPRAGTSPRAPGLKSLLAAACLAAFSTWTKQIEILLVPSLAFYLLLAWGARCALRFLAWSLAVGIAMSYALLSIFGFEETWFNVVVIPSILRSHFRSDFGVAIVELFLGSSLFLLVAALCLRGRRWHGFAAMRRSLRRETWTLPAIVALCLAPATLVGRTVHGGDQNSFHSVFFLAVAAMLLLRGWQGANGRWPFAHLAAFLAVVTVPGPGFGVLADVYDNPNQQAYEYALRHPETAYFPFYPMSTLLADGKLYHYEQTLAEDLRPGGVRISEEHFRAHVPKHLQYVFYKGKTPTREALRWLPECRFVGEIEEMPGWDAYRCDGADGRD